MAVSLGVASSGYMDASHGSRRRAISVTTEWIDRSLRNRGAAAGVVATPTCQSLRPDPSMSITPKQRRRSLANQACLGTFPKQHPACSCALKVPGSCFPPAILPNLELPTSLQPTARPHPLKPGNKASSQAFIGTYSPATLRILEFLFYPPLPGDAFHPTSWRPSFSEPLPPDPSVAVFLPRFGLHVHRFIHCCLSHPPKY